MVTEENGSRVEALKHTLEIIADVYSLSRDENPKGINIKFFNSTKRYTNVRKKHVAGIVDKHRFQGLTRIGTELKRKILDSFVKPTMERPVLIITITDGDVSVLRMGEWIVNC